MKEIKLTQGKIAIIDDGDFGLINKYKWHAVNTNGKGIFYAERKVTKKGQDSHRRMHRLIMNATEGELIDHIDGDTLNNQRNNLRTSTHSQNGSNRKSATNSSSKYLGVSWKKEYKKWRAQIRVGGTCKTIGTFFTEEEAALAYNKAATKFHGEFARLNFITLNLQPSGSLNKNQNNHQQE